jgi:hypothetical protein
MSSTRVIFLLGAVFCIVALIALIKAGGGLRKPNAAAQRESLSEVFNFRRLLAQALGLFAALCFVACVMSLFHLDSSSHRGDWKIAVVMIALSQFLVLCVWLLVRKKR